MHTYLVGGAVRDRLLGRAVRERDWVVTGATPQDMLDRGFRRKDPQFPVFLHPDTGEEYALARRERKHDAGHKGFLVEFDPTVTLEEDLARRDLTVNAIAEDAAGTLVDPHAGHDALRARRLCHVTEAFVEDPLRVLRLARFHAELAPFRFTVDAATLALAAIMSHDRDLQTLSGGRVWRETARALACPAPAVYFLTLAEVGALQVLMPWLTSGADSSASLCALERAARASDDMARRLATLCVAAGAQPPAQWPLPAQVRALAVLCVAHPPAPLGGGGDPVRVVRWLETVDAWRRGDRFDAAVSVWRAADPARAGELDCLTRARDASTRVPPPPPGSDPRLAVRRYREERIRAVLSGAST